MKPPNEPSEKDRERAAKLLHQALGSSSRYPLDETTDLLTQAFADVRAEGRAERDQWWEKRGHKDGKGGCFYQQPPDTITAALHQGKKAGLERAAEIMCGRCGQRSPIDVKFTCSIAGTHLAMWPNGETTEVACDAASIWAEIARLEGEEKPDAKV